MSIQPKIDRLIDKLLEAFSSFASEIDAYEYDLESVGTHGRTPLMIAASEGLEDAFEMLVDKGAKVTMKFLDANLSGSISSSAMVGRLSIAKVLPHWDAATKTNRIPYVCFELVEKLGRNEHVPDLESILDSMWTQCDDLLWRSDGDVNALMVGFASIQLVRQCAGTWTGCENVEMAASDLDIEPSMNDSYFLASCAYCGGAPWEDGSDNDKRREFWQEWLKDIASVRE